MGKFNKLASRKETTAMKKDIVIPVVGPRGVGKSTFINTLLMKVNTTSGTSTSAVVADYIETIHGYDELKDYRIVIIDTPGFDDTYQGDSEILKMIADLLEKSYKKAELGGVIYLHDISRDSFAGMAHRNLDMFQHLTGQDIFSNVVLGTTKWKGTNLDLGGQRQKQLRDVYWKFILENGSQIRPFDDTYESAWGFIDDIMATLEERWETREPDKDKPPGNKSTPGTHVGLVSRPNLKAKDIVIPVIGPASAEKSSFIKTLAPHDVQVDLKPPTNFNFQNIQPMAGYDRLKDHRIFVVDTPGLEGSFSRDSENLRKISELTKGSKATLGGIIYLHDISSDPFTDGARWNLEMFRSLSGQDAVQVVFGVTKWKQTTEGLAEQRQKELQERLLDKGARVYLYEDTYESAWDFIDNIIHPPETSKPHDISNLELREDKDIIPETEAGEAVHNTPKEDDSNQKLPHEDAKSKFQGVQDTMQKTFSRIFRIPKPGSQASLYR